jgi:dihydroorotase
MQFDLLIRGGHVVDPASGTSAPRDVAIKRNRIAAVDANIPAEAAARVIDAQGQYVTPGLIDLHTHVYHGCTYWGVQADPVAARTGVTTWLDVGSAGAYSIMGFRDYIARPAQARIYALLNISSIGLIAQTWELGNLGYCDVDLCTRLIDANRNLVLGVKARIDRNTTLNNGIEPLKLAREAADRVGLPLMAHVSYGPPTLAEVLPYLKEGDILTHCFTGGDMRIIDAQGALLDDVKAAWDRGVVMDIGHGGGSFSFEVAEAMTKAGYQPDVISSDIHQTSILGPCFDLPTCMSKFMALGLSFEDVVKAATVNAAKAMGMAGEIGTLQLGAVADVALFTLERGSFTYFDVHMNRYEGDSLIRNTLTILDGQELPRDPAGADGMGERPMPWIARTDKQEFLVEQGLTPTMMAQAAHSKVDGERVTG